MVQLILAINNILLSLFLTTTYIKNELRSSKWNPDSDAYAPIIMSISSIANLGEKITSNVTIAIVPIFLCVTVTFTLHELLFSFGHNIHQILCKFSSKHYCSECLIYKS